ncbi:MAG: 8-oxo-dGTP diphosphatase MutT [Halieaceae bacterium]|nr:8-oxo-dGTP diphosphatase MutT [Halieaceae bacterium]
MIVVAVGVVLDSRGRVLLTRRRDDTHQGGLWEFPGGKVEAGESVADALRRELREELAIEVEAHEPLLVLEHDYGDRHVRLDVHCVMAFAGEPRPCEGQPMAWVARADLGSYAFPAANAPIVDRLVAGDDST